MEMKNLLCCQKLMCVCVVLVVVLELVPSYGAGVVGSAAANDMYDSLTDVQIRVSYTIIPKLQQQLTM